MGRPSPPAGLPLRWEEGERPARLPVPLPPGRMAPLRGGRPLKRWRYVAVFGEQLMLCVGSARVGPLRSSWWAVWDRGRGELAEATGLGRGGVRFGPGGAVAVRDRGVRIEATVDEGAAVETLNAHGGQYVWTRKQAARPARARVTRGGRTVAVEGLAVVDDTAGYHARVTEWLWCAGVGRAEDGAPVGWNLVSGVNDGPAASERSVWHADAAHEVGPVAIAPDLTAVAFAEGGGLRFAAEAVRERREDFLRLVRSDYRQPFGTFSGRLPGIGALAEGYGVMEHHIARW